MARNISPEKQDEFLEQLLAEQKDIFVNFYKKNQNLFSEKEKAEALKYFDAEGEDIAPNELYKRREACLNNLLSAETYAQRIKNREQSLRKEVQERLGALPIAFDTKKKLLDEFFTTDLEGKEAVLKAVEKEEQRVAAKRKVQHTTIEGKKSEYHSKLESGEFQIYFSSEDREFAWLSLLAVLQTLRTNASRISRIQIFIDMLPGSLAHAKAQDALYQKLLQQKILDPKKRKSLLIQFRAQSCIKKNSTITQLQEQEAEKTTETKETETLPAKNPDHEDEIAIKKNSNLTEYQAYYDLFPHGESPSQFAELDIMQQTENLKKRRENHLEELSLLNIYSSLDTKDDKELMSRLLRFKKLPLNQKKAHIDQFLQQIPDDPDETNNRGRELLKIVIEILRNKNRIVFASDQERIKLINERIKAKHLSLHFSDNHFKSIKTILADFDEDRWDQPQTLSLAERRLREREYVG